MLQQHSLATTVYSAFMVSALYKCCSWKIKHTAIYKWYQWPKRLHDHAWKQMEVNKSSLLGEVAILDSAFKKKGVHSKGSTYIIVSCRPIMFLVSYIIFLQNVHTQAHTGTRTHTRTESHTHLPIYTHLNSFLIPLCCHTENKGQLSLHALSCPMSITCFQLVQYLYSS